MKSIIYLFLVLLTSCASLNKLPADRYANAQPAEYKIGFNDGCFSGQDAAGYLYAKYKKDVEKSNIEPLYKQGWDDGFQLCKSKHEASRRDFGY